MSPVSQGSDRLLVSSWTQRLIHAEMAITSGEYLNDVASRLSRTSGHLTPTSYPQISTGAGSRSPLQDRIRKVMAEKSICFIRPLPFQLRETQENPCEGDGWNLTRVGWGHSEHPNTVQSHLHLVKVTGNVCLLSLIPSFGARSS